MSDTIAIAALAGDDVMGAPAARAPRLPVLSSAETSECSCPEWCERDHDRD